MKTKLISICLALILALSCLPVYADDAEALTPALTIAPAPLVIASAPCALEGLSIQGISDIVETDDGFMLVDSESAVIWKLTDESCTVMAGTLYTYAHGDGDAAEAYFMEPWAMVPFNDGYAISDADAGVIRFLADGKVSTLNTKNPLKRPTGLATDGTNLYIADSESGTITKMTPAGATSTFASGLNAPTGLCWADGKLYICETGKNRIVSTAGSGVTVVSGKATYDDGEYIGGFVDGEAEDAEFLAPENILVEDGVIYIADSGNGAVRYIEDGRVYTLISDKRGEALINPRALFINGDTLYVSDVYGEELESVKLDSFTFTDVSATYALREELMEAAKRGIIYGKTATRFAPKEKVKKSAFILMLSRYAMNENGFLVINGDTKFTDVSETANHAGAASWAADAGYIDASGEFDGSVRLTREQAVVILYKYACENGYDVSVGEDTNILSYNDAFDISEGCFEAFQWACGAGIVNGFKDGTLRPQKVISRAEAAAMFVRLGNNY